MYLKQSLYNIFHLPSNIQLKEVFIFTLIKQSENNTG